MSGDGTGLGDRMKAYEADYRFVLSRDSWCVLRVDVRAAHSFLRHAVKPFDAKFSSAMVAVAEALCTEIQGARLAFSQSDEVSVIYRGRNAESEPWFGGVIAKQISISAAIATTELARWYALSGHPVFDSRVFTLPSVEEVANYLIWRQRDAIRNSVSMVAQSVFSHRQLQNKSGPEMREMLLGRGLNYDDIDAGDRMGRETRRKSGIRQFTYVDKRSGEVHVAEAERSWWETRSAHFYTVGSVDLT